MSSIDQVSEERASVRSDLSAIFVSLGTQPNNVARHVVVTGQRGEDVQAPGAWRRCRGPFCEVFPTAGEVPGADRAAAPSDCVNTGVNWGHGAGVRRDHLLMPDTVLPVVPGVHWRDPRCFV